MLGKIRGVFDLVCLIIVASFLVSSLSGCERQGASNSGNPKTVQSKPETSGNGKVASFEGHGTTSPSSPDGLAATSDTLASFPRLADKTVSASEFLQASNPLEKAQKEYLVAYEKYVKMLRESGPQTLETLHALADYQKKYRLYQTLLDTQNAK